MNDQKTPEQIAQEAVKAAAAINESVKNKISFALGPSMDETMEKSGFEKSDSGELMYALKQISGSANNSKRAPALAFTENPAPSDNFLGLYKTKRRALPDEVLKQI